MSIFDMATQTAGLQSAASALATALVPKRSAAVQTAGVLSPIGVKANSTASSTTTDTTGDATISSSDFLTLLVTELQNQDPTQPTDPNAYIQQLVGVNSLQQLISINQGISTIDGGASTTTGSSVSSPNQI